MWIYTGHGFWILDSDFKDLELKQTMQENEQWWSKWYLQDEAVNTYMSLRKWKLQSSDPEHKAVRCSDHTQSAGCSSDSKSLWFSFNFHSTFFFFSLPVIQTETLFAAEPSWTATVCECDLCCWSWSGLKRTICAGCRVLNTRARPLPGHA